MHLISNQPFPMVPSVRKVEPKGRPSLCLKVEQIKPNKKNYCVMKNKII